MLQFALLILLYFAKNSLDETPVENIRLWKFHQVARSHSRLCQGNQKFLRSCLGMSKSVSEFFSFLLLTTSLYKKFKQLWLRKIVARCPLESPPPSTFTQCYIAFLGPHHLQNMSEQNHQSTTKVILNEPPITQFSFRHNTIQQCIPRSFQRKSEVHCKFCTFYSVWQVTICVDKEDTIKMIYLSIFPNNRRRWTLLAFILLEMGHFLV